MPVRLLVLDISATANGREPDYELVRKGLPQKHWCGFVMVAAFRP